MNAFTVTLQAPAAADATPDAQVEAPRIDDRAAGVLQSAIERALCARAETRPGSFRLAMQLWIDPSGSVTEAAALAPSEDPMRDEAVLSAARKVRTAGALHRFSPVTVLLTPSSGTDPCRATRGSEG